MEKQDSAGDAWARRARRSDRERARKFLEVAMRKPDGSYAQQSALDLAAFYEHCALQ